MDSTLLHDHIEAYLSGAMDPDARKLFEQEITHDPSLKAQVDLHREANKAISYGLYKQRKAHLSVLDRQLESRTPVRTLWIRRLAVAASILLVCAVGTHFYVHHTFAHQTIASRMYDPVTQETFRSPDVDRAPATQQMEAAGDFFRQGDYDQARMLYLEIIQGESLLEGQAEWNLLMCYLAENPTAPQFEVLLKKILEDPAHPYYENALELRSRMDGLFYRIAN